MPSNALVIVWSPHFGFVEILSKINYFKNILQNHIDIMCEIRLIRATLFNLGFIPKII